MQETCTLTFCESGENHVGMQIIGQKSNSGFTIQELQYINQQHPTFTEYHCLNNRQEQEPAGILVKKQLELIGKRN